MHPRIDVTVAAIVERRHRFLMVEERVGADIVFNQPAGHLEPGESVLDAVVRETMEETGYRFEPARLIGVYSWLHPDNQQSFLRICCAGEADERPPQAALDTGIIAVHWLTRDELCTGRRNLRSAMVMRCIDDYLAGASYPLSCLSHVVPPPSLLTRRA